MRLLKRIDPVEVLAFGYSVVLLFMWATGRDVPPALTLGCGVVLGFFLGRIGMGIGATADEEPLGSPYIPGASDPDESQG